MALENYHCTESPTAFVGVPNTVGSHAGLTDTGRVRATNEDRWHADSSQQLYIVSDGMGGQAAGELAARAVVELLPVELARVVNPQTDLTDPLVREQVLEAVRKLSHDLYRESHGRPGVSGMGATLVAAIVRSDRALILHLGDSRAYLSRDRHLQRLTHDHSLVQQLVDGRVLSAEEAAHHPARGQLTRFVGMSSEATPEASLVDFLPGDRLLLCTDGLTGMLDDSRIEMILNQESEPASACRCLVEAANQAGGKDNITVLIVARLPTSA